MPRKATAFFLSFFISFVVLAMVSILIEYFDSGDDPLYSLKDALRNMAIALIVAATTIWQINKKRVN